MHTRLLQRDISIRHFMYVKPFIEKGKSNLRLFLIELEFEHIKLRFRRYFFKYYISDYIKNIQETRYDAIKNCKKSVIIINGLSSMYLRSFNQDVRLSNDKHILQTPYSYLKHMFRFSNKT